jgi:hypothetical protein
MKSWAERYDDLSSCPKRDVRTIIMHPAGFQYSVAAPLASLKNAKVAKLST